MLASNMDTVGTFEMAEAFSKYDMFTTIHKHYSIDQWKAFAETSEGQRVTFLLLNVSIT